MCLALSCCVICKFDAFIVCVSVCLFLFKDVCSFVCVACRFWLTICVLVVLYLFGCYVRSIVSLLCMAFDCLCLPNDCVAAVVCLFFV